MHLRNSISSDLRTASTKRKKLNNVASLVAKKLPKRNLDQISGWASKLHSYLLFIQKHCLFHKNAFWSRDKLRRLSCATRIIYLSELELIVFFCTWDAKIVMYDIKKIKCQHLNMERTVQKCVKLAQFVLLLKLAKLLKLVRSIVETSEQLNLEDKVILLANFIKLWFLTQML